ncbi:hypothetical protein [Paraburkholderia youngii]|uniref:hypothetical protein n=1 Tax=Paraburkholderia youngii TaxID=2782701 RepID=UPI003D21BF2B
MLLTHEQAACLYAAMTCANDVEASYRLTMKHPDGTSIIVEEAPDGLAVRVLIDNGATIAEHYANQASFALAYGVAI